MEVKGLQRVASSDVLTIGADDKVIDVAGLFERKNSGIAMVCDADDNLIGVVSLGDIVHTIGKHGAAGLEMPASRIMTSDVAVCDVGDDIETVLEKMDARGIRHLPVVEGGKLRGFIEKRKALEAMYEEAALDFAQLRNYVFKPGDSF